MHSYDHGESWLGALLGLIFLAAMIGLAVYVVRALTNGKNSVSNVRDPIDIAKERYANGDITKEQLAEIRKELK